VEYVTQSPVVPNRMKRNPERIVSESRLGAAEAAGLSRVCIAWRLWPATSERLRTTRRYQCT